MKRFSERFFNPRPAPEPAEAEEAEQYGIAYSDGIAHNTRAPQLHLDGFNEGTLNNSSAHDHAALPMQNEVMAAASTGPKSKQREEQVYPEEKRREEHSYPVEKQAQSPQPRPLSLANGTSRNRLPTLAEVLARRTLPPVDLYCFYLFMQREGSEDALDFWLDVQQHENLCRAYFKDVRKHGGNVQEDWPGYYREARERGSIYGTVTGIEQVPNAWRSGGEKQAGFAEADQGRAETESMMGGYGRDSDGEWHLPNPGQPRFPGDPDYAMPRESSSERAERKNNLFKRSSMAPTVIPRQTAISRADLVASAERIYARYLLPGSEKEIYLPPQLRITSFPLSSSTVPDAEDETQQAALARVPDMFHTQKEYVFRTIEADVFPRFLRAKAFGNLTPVSALIRLTLGLLALWAGFATAFSFIFLEVNRQKRLWVILPFAVAVLLIVSHQYELDPVLALAQQSETTPFHLITVRERYVRKLLLQRALGVVFLIVLITAALTVLFVFVPGHRL